MTTHRPSEPAASLGPDEYCYPGTDTLRNKLAIVDPSELRRAEYFLTTFNQATLPPVEFSPDGLKAVHQHLFGDLYDWAGTYRTCEMIRIPDNGGHPVSFANAAELDTGIAKAFTFVPDPGGERVNFAEFATQATGMTGALNWLHPFREGNGRTIRAFLTSWSHRQGHPIDFTTWTRQEWLQATTAAYHHDNEPMLDLIASHIKRLDPVDLQRTITEWGQAHLDLDQLDHLIDRADQALRYTTNTQQTVLADTVEGLLEQRDGLIETIYDLERRLSVDARARGLGTWRTLDASPTRTQQPDTAVLEALGAVSQHRDAWQPPSPVNTDHQHLLDHNAIKALHRTWADNIVTRSPTPHPPNHDVRLGPDLGRT
jgi:cell filamentation protein